MVLAPDVNTVAGYNSEPEYTSEAGEGNYFRSEWLRRKDTCTLFERAEKL